MAGTSSLSVLISDSDKEARPSCARDCMWYEASEEDASCLNRQNLICNIYRAEIFENND